MAYVMKPCVHSRDRSFDLMNYQAIMSFIIPPAYRTIMARWEEEEEDACIAIAEVSRLAEKHILSRTGNKKSGGERRGESLCLQSFADKTGLYGKFHFKHMSRARSRFARCV
jgi:hypothetical protein